jgi:hypothetical protein
MHAGRISDCMKQFCSWSLTVEFSVGVLFLLMTSQLPLLLSPAASREDLSPAEKWPGAAGEPAGQWNVQSPSSSILSCPQGHARLDPTSCTWVAGALVHCLHRQVMLTQACVLALCCAIQALLKWYSYLGQASCSLCLALRQKTAVGGMVVIPHSESCKHRQDGDQCGLVCAGVCPSTVTSSRVDCVCMSGAVAQQDLPFLHDAHIIRAHSQCLVMDTWRATLLLPIACLPATPASLIGVEDGACC